MNLICRASLQDAYKADDERCGVCPGNKCQVTSNVDQYDERSPKQDVTSSSTSSSTTSPFIVSFYDAYFREGEFFMLFEYMGNGNLHQLCERGWIPSNYDMAVICYSVLSAIIELHSKRIMHRDIKVHIFHHIYILYLSCLCIINHIIQMNNIMVTQNGCIKVVDFGIIK